jgi:glycosyltransferase involved in cell wall biosynthesis
MHACDVVVFPSTAAFGEGFGLAALEALAAGRPVIASNVASLPEIIEHEITGLLFPSEDAVALATALRRLIADPARRESLGRSARDRAVTTFSRDAMVDGVLGVYDEVRAS